MKPKVCSRCGKEYTDNTFQNEQWKLLGMRYMFVYQNSKVKNVSVPYYLCDSCLEGLCMFMNGNGLNNSNQQIEFDDILKMAISNLLTKEKTKIHEIRDTIIDRVLKGE